jgi:N-ethylmaleimide reductase
MARGDGCRSQEGRFDVRTALAHRRDVTPGLLRRGFTDVCIQCESSARECYLLGTEPHRSTSPNGTAAKNATEAGFDGVQIQANFLYLIAQFINSVTNLRKDEYGGSTVNRARFLFEIIERVLEFVEPGRVGIKIGPMNISGPFLANADTLPDMEYVIKKLNDYDLAHLLMMGATTDFTGGPLEHLAGDGMFQHFRPFYSGHIIANVDMTQERGNRLIKTGLADSIAFGRPYIANPDLPERFLVSATLNEISWPTVYASGPNGYIDYPAMRRSSPDEDSPKRTRRQTELLSS